MRKNSKKFNNEIDTTIPFFNGIKIVESNGLFAIQDCLSHRLLTDYIYNQIDEFKHSYTKVQRNNCYGYLRYDGKEIIPCIYSILEECFDNYFIAKDMWGYYGIIDRMNNVIIPFNYFGITKTYNNCFIIKNEDSNFAVVDCHGNLIIDFNYQEISEIPNSDFYIVYNDLMCGIYDLRGREIIPCKYSDISKTYYNSFILKNVEGVCAVVDCHGNLIIDFNYQEISEFPNSEFYKVSNGSMDGIYDLWGREIIPCKYSYISLIVNNSFFIVYKYNNQKERGIYDGRGNQVGLYDIRGNEIVPCKYSNLLLRNDSIIASYEKYEKYEFLNEFRNDKIELYSLYTYQGYLLESNLSKIPEFIDDFYKIVKREFYYYDIYKRKTAYTDCSYCLNIDGYYFLFDKEEIIVIPYDYSCPVLFEDGNIKISSRVNPLKKGLIDKTGRLILNLEYDDIICLSASNNVYLALKDEKYHLCKYEMNKMTCTIVNKQPFLSFDLCRIIGHEHDFSVSLDDYFIVSFKKNEYGVIDYNNNVIVSCEYYHIHMQNSRYFILHKTIDKMNNVYLFDRVNKDIINMKCEGLYFNEYANTLIFGLRSVMISDDLSLVLMAIKKDGLWWMRTGKGIIKGKRGYDYISFNDSFIDCYYEIVQYIPINKCTIDGEELDDAYIEWLEEQRDDEERYRKEKWIDEYDVKGNFRESRREEDYSSGDWTDIGKEEEDYIYNNGGDWILDND